MPLEVATYISQLDRTWPVGGTDDYATADDHLRLVKGVLQDQFPNLGEAAVEGTAAQLNELTDAIAAGITTEEIVYLDNLTGNIQSQLDGKAASSHTHSIAQVTGLQTELDGKAAVAHNHPASDIVSGTLANARISQSSVTQHQGAINHDALGGFVSNEHVDHSAVSINVSTGLFGGGSITQTRTIGLSAASTSAIGGIELATQAEVDAGTDNSRAVTPATLAGATNRVSWADSGQPGGVTGTMTTATSISDLPAGSYVVEIDCTLFSADSVGFDFEFPNHAIDVSYCVVGDNGGTHAGRDLLNAGEDEIITASQIADSPAHFRLVGDFTLPSMGTSTFRVSSNTGGVLTVRNVVMKVHKL